MTFEIVAALLLGLSVLLLVLAPLTRTGGPSGVPDEPEEFEETAKGMALSALKEIEFDRATGKLSDDDYELLKARYTAKALEVLRSEEAAGSSPAAPPVPASEDADAAETLIAARLRQMRSGAARCPQCGPRPESDAAYCSNCGRLLAGVRVCASCGGALVPDGRFCGSCGSSVAA